MKQEVRNKGLIERFNRYVEYRKTVEKSGKKTGESFTEQLRHKSAPKREERDRQPSTSCGPHTPPPKLGQAKKITASQAKRLARLAPLIEEAASRHQVPVELICGVILQESGGQCRAVSRAGARGLMQLMPATARRFGVKNSFDPHQNIEGGTRYLRWLIDRFDGDLELALAGYNAGEGNVEKHGNKIPPFKETRQYVPGVLGYTQTMIDIFQAKINHTELPEYARRA